MRLYILSAISLILATLVSACAVMPPSTGYVEAKDDQEYGYRIVNDQGATYGMIYRGNQYTRSHNAMLYAMAAGFEHCQQKGKLAYITVPKDFSSKSTYTHVSSYQTPVYGSDGKISSYTSNVSSYPVTMTYPQYSSSATCLASFKVIENLPELESIPRELVHGVTKDFKGGLLVKVIDGPTPLRENDVIVRINGIRIENGTGIFSALENYKGKSVKLGVVRDQKIISLTGKVKDLTPAIEASQAAAVSLICEKVSRTEPSIVGGSPTRAVPYPAMCTPYTAAETGKKL